MKDEKIKVAIVLKPQGVRGEIKVKTLTDSSRVFSAFKSILIGGEQFSVLSVRPQGEFAYLCLKGIADRNAAELLRGKDIEVAREDMPEPPDGRYYIADLLDCNVVNERGDFLGKVIDVTPAATDIFTIEKNGKQIMFAAAEGVILNVDAEIGVITVSGKRFREVSL